MIDPRNPGLKFTAKFALRFAAAHTLIREREPPEAFKHFKVRTSPSPG